MRILMGTYALSAGYYDAYYKRAQQVQLFGENKLALLFKLCKDLVYWQLCVR